MSGAQNTIAETARANLDQLIEVFLRKSLIVPITVAPRGLYFLTKLCWRR